MIAALETETDKMLAVEMDEFAASSPMASLIVLAVASGVNPKQIESLTGVNAEAINYLCFEHRDLANLFQANNKFANETDNERLCRIARQAVQVKVDILYSDSADATLKNKVAEEVLDRAYGKARQFLETSVSITNPDEAIKKLSADLESTLKAVGLTSIEDIIMDVEVEDAQHD